MTYRVCKVFVVESGHMLSKHPDNCRFPHGHSRRIELVVASERLDAGDMVCDFGHLKEAMTELLERYDHALCMNSRDARFEQMRALFGERVVAFDDTDPTTEVMARAVFDHVKAELTKHAPSARLCRVRVWETATSWAEFEE